MLGALRKLRAGTDAAAAAASETTHTLEAIPTVSLAGQAPEDFERLRGPVAHLRFHIEPPASPAALLRQLGAPPSWSLDETPAEVLGPLCAAAGALARELALLPGDEAAPSPLSTPIPYPLKSPMSPKKEGRYLGRRATRSPRVPHLC